MISIFVWLKVMRLAQRVLTRRGGDFVTTHGRPKRTEAIGTWSDPLEVPPKVAVVVQGPMVVVDRFTFDTVKLYRRHFRGNPVIVSAWEGEPAETLDAIRNCGAEVVCSRPPVDPGPLNVNLQIAGTRAGIGRARELGCDYVLKTRSDQRIHAPSAGEFLVNLSKAFPVRTGFRQKQRIVSCGRSGYKFGLYQVSDQILFGHIDDMETYFSAPPRPSALPDDYRDVIGQICRHKAPEAYLASCFLEAVGRPVKWTLADSWDALADHFVMADWTALDVYWPKYGPHVEHDVRYDAIFSTQRLDFREWLALSRFRPDPVIGEAALNLPLHAAMPPPAVDS